MITGSLLSLGMGSAIAGGSSQDKKNSSSNEITVVKCLGVAKAGYNGCGSTDGRHNCSGKATKHLDPTEWIYLPDGPLCENIGGKKMVKNGKIVKKKKARSSFVGGDNS